MKTKLSVNLNKIALIRNARDDGNPSPVEFGEIALKAGAAMLFFHEAYRREDAYDGIVNSLEVPVNLVDFIVSCCDE